MSKRKASRRGLPTSRASSSASSSTCSRMRAATSRINVPRSRGARQRQSSAKRRFALATAASTSPGELAAIRARSAPVAGSVTVKESSPDLSRQAPSMNAPARWAVASAPCGTSVGVSIAPCALIVPPCVSTALFVPGREQSALERVQAFSALPGDQKELSRLHPRRLVAGDDVRLYHDHHPRGEREVGYRGEAPARRAQDP